ncbi:ArnT family glycosyltransferase [Rubinisphaera brasiliensis]|uniref:Glycosyl transferase family 39 n=1 Tax=Rubinisphaera brasiliensis (strain ATCC 49424 / DSM 5305 / JCM 21570 / IAM 15109 / NBRC 103401 / IFAM 1448) TaxID=756272 RepID=F0SRM7_RUBBR|nr:glycosyltransferase family 39 protein [Rubinisphaera brasiliensis]ADY59150.1 glycosyl transferase family 39 [Rubinisphaera brasiliensis DSM 5305]
MPALSGQVERNKPSMIHPKHEKWLLLAMLLVAAWLRFASYWQSPIEHFDEGVYASNYWFDASEGFRYPDRHLYAPPLLPTVIEWTHLFLGPGTLACLLPNLLAGFATVPLVWLFVRRMMGPIAALAATSMWACLDYPVLYSRTALTDSMLCFWMLLSVLLAERGLSLCRQRWPRGAEWIFLLGGAGLAAGLAWLTKYNGWLSLAVTVSAAIAWGVTQRFALAEWRRVGVGLLIICGVAGAVWTPYMLSLEEYGGYSAVAENHRQYFVGLSGWGASFLHQAGNLQVLTGSFTIVNLIILTQALFFGFAWPRTDVPDELDSPTEPALARLGTWQMASWFLGLLVAVPLYHPYPRLLLPWLLACSFLWGTAVYYLFKLLRYRARIELSEELLRSERPSHWITWILVGFWVLLSAMGVRPDSNPGHEDRRELKEIASFIVETAGGLAEQAGGAAEEVILYTYGEPALFYHLSDAGRLAGPIGHLDFATQPPPAPTFLVTGPHAQRSPLFREQWKEHGSKFVKLGEWDYTPSEFIQRNSLEPIGTVPIRLYLLKPPELHDLEGDRNAQLHQTLDFLSGRTPAGN